MTHIYLIYALLALLAIVMFNISKFVIKNHEAISHNRSLIQKNEDLINKNAQLINIINIMLSHSELNIDWKMYADRLKKLGIIIDDDFRNQDIEDPEG